MKITEPGVVPYARSLAGAITVKPSASRSAHSFYPHDKKRYKITQKIVDGKKLLVYDDETTITEPTAGDELFLQIKR